MIKLSGLLTCKDEDEAAVLAAHLPDHVALSRAEPGCLKFEVTQISPTVWQVDEAFVDRAAFEAHGVRTKASVWATATTDIARKFQIFED